MVATVIMNRSMTESEEVAEDLRRACGGCRDALDRLFSRYTLQLERMIRLRLDPKLRARVSAEDILQEAYCQVLCRLSAYCDNPSVPFHIWLRLLISQELINARRHHLGVQKRSAEVEVSINRNQLPQIDTASIARQLIGKYTSPTQAALRSEVQLTVQRALNEMDAVDREIIVLRNFEHLSNNEAAQVLGLHKAAASKRYISALKRLQAAIQSHEVR